MSLVDTRTVLKFLGLDTLTTEDKNLDEIHAATEKWVEEHCHRTFASTSYKEKYDGNGQNELVLDNYPIISLSRLCMGVDEAMRVKNTNTGAYASVSVSTTGVTLNKDGTTTTLTFATYTTMNTLATAICAQSGWSATLSLSTYGTWPSSLLVEKMGLQCINSSEVSLNMPSTDGEWDFEVDSTRGIIHSPFGFIEGTRNIYVEYVAGYATGSLPKDLELAILILVKFLYQKRSEESWGASSYSVSGISMSFEQDMPLQARQILSRYKRTLI